VPILPDDTALDVFRKVTVAAELVLDRALPGILDGTVRMRDQDLARGSYFGARKPEDGRVDWSRDAKAVHDLVRAVAPPYPGAFSSLAGARLRLLRTRVLEAGGPARAPSLALDEAGRLVARCGGGGTLQVLSGELDGARLDAELFRRRFGAAPVPLGDPQ
jgi:methionyl-tRNA formyltransferase